MNDDVCVMIPALNEEATIGDVIKGFTKRGLSDVLVIDGRSVDRTREIAENAGARVIVQEGKGKGQALRQAFEIINKDIIVITDGDGSYDPSEVDKILAPIRKGEADHVIGNRFANPEEGAFTSLNKFGNKILNGLFEVGFGIKLRDVLSGYRAIKREALEKLELSKPGFEIEAEMCIESMKKGLAVIDVPIHYYVRGGRTKLKSIRDGTRIGYTIYTLVSTYNPIIYFGLLGLAFILAGVISGVYVVLDWLNGVTRVPLTVLTALLIIAGVQIFIFGLLGNIMLTLHREILREVRGRK